MTTTMTLQWEPLHHEKTETVERSVKLTDAPDITWKRKAKYGPAHGRPYSIRFKFTRYGNGPWIPDITIYAQRPGIPVGDWFSPRAVIDMPEWLADLITEATPA
ncbi:hypothetical protein [Paractinoplanes toevensis]|uniref:Uncharacterized protein n=1 Tax=Paractinoplanes toevensis TaxID=571911 RepID=A0A919T3X3_9ACTN|nr:hypothetical protein [Actinoplanes toevensis]GIM88763.1 hypothetical protein Ato02nite_005560 [Actinoplanes toevensis]